MAINSIQLPNGQTIEIGEWLHWPIFSTLEAQGGIDAATDPLNLGFGASVRINLFSYVEGNPVPQAGAVPGGPRRSTAADTNQNVKGRMNYDEAFLMFSQTYEIFALNDGTTVPNLPNNVEGATPAFTGTNLRRLQRDAMFELTVGAGISKPQARAPFSYYGQGVGATAFGPGTELIAPPQTINMDYGTGGPISPRNQRSYVLPVYIHSDRTMRGKFYTPGGRIAGLNQSYRLRWYLDGLKRRPVA